MQLSLALAYKSDSEGPSRNMLSKYLFTICFWIMSCKNPLDEIDSCFSEKYKSGIFIFSHVKVLTVEGKIAAALYKGRI